MPLFSNVSILGRPTTFRRQPLWQEEAASYYPPKKTQHQLQNRHLLRLPRLAAIGQVGGFSKINRRLALANNMIHKGMSKQRIHPG